MDVQQFFRSGYVAIVGPPNAGKSTLLNTLLDQKLAIVTPKPQTTRKRVLGILTGENYQIIFIDTPGIIKPSYDLQKRLMDRFGGLFGWLLATVCYAAVHIWSFNFMLIGAAAVAGAFWGAMYWRLSDLTPVIVSHSLWSAVIFTLLPIPGTGMG